MHLFKQTTTPNVSSHVYDAALSLFEQLCETSKGDVRRPRIMLEWIKNLAGEEQLPRRRELAEVIAIAEMQLRVLEQISMAPLATVVDIKGNRLNAPSLDISLARRVASDD